MTEITLAKDEVHILESFASSLEIIHKYPLSFFESNEVWNGCLMRSGSICGGTVMLDVRGGLGAGRRSQIPGRS